MIVRKNPLRNSPMVGYNGLTTDGKNHDKDKNGSLDSGTVVTCKDVYYYADEVWLKIPSGWVCGYDATTLKHLPLSESGKYMKLCIISNKTSG